MGNCCGIRDRRGSVKDERKPLKYYGGGVLGGDTSLTDDEKRRQIAEAAEARNKNNYVVRNVSNKSSTISVEVFKGEENNNNNNNNVIVNVREEETADLLSLGDGQGPSLYSATSDNPALLAALKRSESSGGSNEYAARQTLIGKIEHYYYEAGEEVPFGLRAADIEVLKKQLEMAKNLKNKRKK